MFFSCSSLVLLQFQFLFKFLFLLSSFFSLSTILGSTTPSLGTELSDSFVFQSPPPPPPSLSPSVSVSNVLAFAFAFACSAPLYLSNLLNFLL